MPNCYGGGGGGRVVVVVVVVVEQSYFIVCFKMLYDRVITITDSMKLRVQ